MLLEDVQGRLRALVPANDAQRSLQARALQISGDLARARWLLREQMEGSIRTPFLVMVVLWVTVIFMSYGLFAPRNPTVIAALFICSLSLAGSIFLILDIDRPFGGLISLSSARCTMPSPFSTSSQQLPRGSEGEGPMTSSIALGDSRSCAPS